MDYAQSPPDSGKHYPTPAPFTKHFYAEADRPPVETLVHNLEHGYTVVWYRADAPSKQIKNLQRIAKTFGSDDLRSGGQVHRGAVVGCRWCWIPGRQEHHDHPLDRRP